MKKYIILTIMLFGFVITQAQTTKTEYNKWSISAEFGSHMVASKTTTSVSDLLSFGGDIRYNINDKLAIGLSGGYDDIDMEVDYAADPLMTPFGLTNTRFNFETYINAFNVVDIYSDRFTFLFHGGPGISFLNASLDSKTMKQTVPNLRGGLTLLIKVVPRVALKGDLSVIGNYTTDEFNGGAQSNAGVNSLISNASIGLTFRLGKHDKHYDDYEPEYIVPITNTYNSDTTIIYNQYTTYSSIVNTMMDTLQYVFFDNDEYVIKDTELGAIFKTFINMDDNDEYTLTIKGLASSSEDETLSDSNDYNMTLSENRANTVKKKFLDMGISDSRITVEFYGKDKALKEVNVHDAARRVELIVSTNK